MNDQKLNWCVVAEHDLSHSGAVQTHVTEFCIALSKITNVTLISYTDDVFFRQNKIELITYQCKRINSFLTSISQLLSSLKLFFFLLILHKKLTTDILYVRGSAFGFGPILFAKLLKIPCLVEINGIWKEEQKLSLNNYSLGKKIIIRPILYLRHLSLLFICKLADIIIAVTPGIAEFLGTNNINTNKIHVVPNGVNIDRFSPHNKEECKNLLPIDDKYNYIGYIGSLSPWQGVDDLLTTFTKFNSTEGYKLLIVGDGEYRQKLEMLVEKYNIKEKVIFTGSQPYHLIPYFICGCEILVTPKKKLSSGYSPLKIYEYLACGRPVIASNVAGLEFIEKNKLGYLYEAGNTEHMFDSIMKLINLSENRKIEKGKKCRKYAEENCSWESTVLKIYDLIN